MKGRSTTYVSRDIHTSRKATWILEPAKIEIIPIRVSSVVWLFFYRMIEEER